MQELGLSAGCEIEVLQEGCPCIVRCKGTRYCLRGNECSCIWVRIGEPS
jgi:Fe2+ transport system protein FeoA